MQEAWAGATGATVPIDTDGTVRVHFPGWRNRSAGPDFRDAVLDTGGTVVRGDVEIHRDARDWIRHGHHSDPRYDNVVLHVVGDAGEDAPGPPRRARAESLDRLPVNGSSTPFGCRSAGDPNDPVRLRATLVAVGMARYRVAAARLGARLAAIPVAQEVDEDRHPLLSRSRGGEPSPAVGAHGVEQIAFEEIAGALGFAGNEAPMRRCAQVMPLSAIRSMAPRSDENTDPALVELLSRSGLRSAEAPDAEPNVLDWRSHRWVLAGVRPANHPLRRLAQLVGIARAWPDDGIVAAVREVLRATHDAPRRTAIRLRSLIAPHARSQRAGDVVVNVLLPLARAGALREGCEADVALADRAFEVHAALAGNAVTARVAARLGFAPREVARTAAAQQGLIAVWDGPCRPLQCGLCPLATGQNA